MGTLAVTNDFSAGTSIVAADMNQNFTDVETFVNSSPGVVQNDLVDAQGDLFAATAADTVTRLAVGSDGQVLTADSTATTGVAWVDPDLISKNSQTGTTYTLVAADSGKIVEMNNASANTLTVPPNSSVAFDVGTQIVVVQQGAGTTTIATAGTPTLRSKDSNLDIDGQYASVALIKRDTDEWYVIGALA